MRIDHAADTPIAGDVASLLAQAVFICQATPTR
jgi:hypothetical protein